MAELRSVQKANSYQCTCSLVKHPRDTGLPAAELAGRPWYVRLSTPGKTTRTY